MTDGELVRQTLAGWTAAYGELARRWSCRVLAVCHARVRRADVAEELAQEALVRGYRGLGTLHDQDKFGAWLCGIATRACLDWLKAKERTTVPFSALGPESQPDAFPARRSLADDPLEQAEEVAQLMSEVEALPDDCREALMLYYHEDLTYGELAEMLGVSAATVNARLTRARALLRERLSPSRR
jgi:RNA polymerase sigma-70 factor (ECF subfamily)